MDIQIGFEYASFHSEKVQAVDHLLLLRNMFGKCKGGSHQCTQESTQKIVKNEVLCFVMNKPRIKDFFHTDELGIDCTPKCGGCKCGKCPAGESNIHWERKES